MKHPTGRSHHDGLLADSALARFAIEAQQPLAAVSQHRRLSNLVLLERQSPPLKACRAPGMSSRNFPWWATEMKWEL